MNVVHLDRPLPFPGTREGVEGTFTFADGVVWRAEGQTETLPLDRMSSISAARVGHIQTALLGGLVVALTILALGLSVVWGIVALWLAAGLRIVLDRLRPCVDVTVEAEGDPWTVRLYDPDAFDWTQRLRSRLPRRSGTTSLDELVHESRMDLRSPHPAARRLGLWLLSWVIGLPLLIWTGIWLAAFLDAYLAGDPVGESFVILGLGPPFSVILWPVSGIFGLLAQAPLAAWILRR